MLAFRPAAHALLGFFENCRYQFVHSLWVPSSISTYSVCTQVDAAWRWMHTRLRRFLQSILSDRMPLHARSEKQRTVIVIANTKSPLVTKFSAVLFAAGNLSLSSFSITTCTTSLTMTLWKPNPPHAFCALVRVKLIDELRSANQTLALSVSRCVRQEDDLFPRRVSDLHSEQSVQLSPCTWRSTRTPPTTHTAVFLFRSG